MAVAGQRGALHERDEGSQKRHQVAAAGQRKVALGMHKMLEELEFRAGHNLTDKEIQVNWGNVLRGVLVHGPDISGQEKFQSRRDVVHIGSGQDGDTSVFQEAPDAAEEARRVFQMFDHFDGRDQIKPIREIAVELRIIEIELYEFRLQLEIVLHVRSRNLKSRGLQPFRKRSAAGPEIQDACSGCRIAQRNFHDLLMRARKRSYQPRGLLPVIPETPVILSRIQRAITS
jgi:hypothetical protein